MAEITIANWNGWKEREKESKLLQNTKWAEALVDQEVENEPPKQLVTSFLNLLLE
jgi:hypothetical protein